MLGLSKNDLLRRTGINKGMGLEMKTYSKLTAEAVVEIQGENCRN